MKKIIALAVLGFVGVTLVGCSSLGTEAEPALTSKGTWNLEYVIVDNDSQAIPCLWHNRTSHMATMDCDWEQKTTEIPAGVDSNKAGEDSWEIEYVSYEGKTIPCLWHSRTTRSATMSCDFS